MKCTICGAKMSRVVSDLPSRRRTHDCHLKSSRDPVRECTEYFLKTQC